VSLVKPILGIALALTLLIQGFVSVRVGVLEASNQKDLGIAGIIAAVLVVKGATWAFLIGILLTLLIYGSRFFHNHAEDLEANDSKKRINTFKNNDFEYENQCRRIVRNGKSWTLLQF